jgi:hypothetical protein
VGTEWIGEPTGLYPVFDYVQIRELCDLAFLPDGRAVIAYWNGDEKCLHCAVGRPGGWADTRLHLPTTSWAADVALAINRNGCPALAVTLHSRDMYYLEYVPEPATISLLAMGGLAIMLRRHRR